MNKLPIITTLAEYQTVFWRDVGLELKRAGHSVRFLSFDSRSNEMLAVADLDFVDATASANRKRLGDSDPAEVAARFGMDRLGFWLTHEKYAFDETDTPVLMRKLAGSLLAADAAIGSLSDDADPVMVQELGGFLSVIGSHFAALHRSIPSILIEPSFFRGRLLYLEGDIAAKKLAPDMRADPAGAVAAYIAETLEKSAIIIPEKDRHQYTTAFRKIVKVKNLKRLGEKLVDKHILGKEQEFGHIGSHVGQHAKMLLNSRRLRGHYTLVSACERFVYYPLHVPGDIALTLRSPEYLDQLALIDYLCRVVPYGVKVAVKEHPAMIGAIDAKRLIELTQRHDNLRIIPPATNNFDVLKSCSAVVSVNSKSGAEAGLLGKPVVVLGDAFYRNAPFAFPIDKLSDLGSVCADVLSGTLAVPDRANIESYFAAMWRHTYPGGLYQTGPGEVETFTRSMIAALE